MSNIFSLVDPRRGVDAAHLERPGFVAGAADTGSCFACGQPLGAGGLRFRDGRSCCPPCASTGVTRVTEGRLILQDVARGLHESGGLDFGDARWVCLALRSQEQLVVSSGRSYAPQPWGSAGAASGNGERLYTVNALYGLPRSSFATLCAHELGHVYMFRHSYPRLDDAVMEGLCRLCEYVWLKRVGTAAALATIDRQMQSDNPVYGAGFRAAHRALGNKRLIDLMEEVRQLGRLP